MTSADIKKEFPNATFISSNGRYIPASKEWLLRQFSPFFHRLLAKEDLELYRERWKMDEYASLYRVIAQASHLTSALVPRTDNLAIGEAMIQRIDVGSSKLWEYSACVALTDEGIVWIDPTTGELFEKDGINPVEHCYFVRF